MLWNIVCCCAKTRKDALEQLSIQDVEQRNQANNKILIEFLNEETKLGLKEINVVEIMEKILNSATNQREIDKSPVKDLFKDLAPGNMYVEKRFLKNGYFYANSNGNKFDLRKLQLFSLLYSGGKELDKINFLFNLAETPISGNIIYNSQKLLSCLEILTYIPCIIVGELVCQGSRFALEEE